MKKMFRFSMVCIAIATVLLLGCGAIEDATTLDIPVDNVRFNFDAITSSDPAGMILNARSASIMNIEGLNFFSVTETVNISDIGNVNVGQYLDKINDVIVNKSQLVITAVPTGAFTISNLKIEVQGSAESLVIPSYTLGDTFIAPAGMISFTTRFFMMLISGQDLTVTVSGQTSAPLDTTIKVTYQNDLVFKAKLL